MKAKTCIICGMSVVNMVNTDDSIDTCGSEECEKVKKSMHVRVECNICHRKFKTIRGYTRHWSKKHYFLYGHVVESPTIRVYGKSPLEKLREQ